MCKKAVSREAEILKASRSVIPSILFASFVRQWLFTETWLSDSILYIATQISNALTFCSNRSVALTVKTWGGDRKIDSDWCAKPVLVAS